MTSASASNVVQQICYYYYHYYCNYYCYHHHHHHHHQHCRRYYYCADNTHCPKQHVLFPSIACPGNGQRGGGGGLHNQREFQAKYRDRCQPPECGSLQRPWRRFNGVVDSPQPPPPQVIKQSRGLGFCTFAACIVSVFLGSSPWGAVVPPPPPATAVSA